MLTRLCCLPLNVFSNGRLTKVETTLITTVRWRKRRWAPITPSKLFSIPERKPENAEESAELKVRYAHYRTEMRSLREYFRNELKAKAASLTDQLYVDQEDKHFAMCIQENNLWNEQSAKFREAREAALAKEKHEIELQQLIDMEDKQKELHTQLRSEVLKTKEESKRFISADDLENAIEVALNQRSNYSFVIDPSGKRHIEQPDGRTVVEHSEDGDDGSAVDVTKPVNVDDVDKEPAK